ncbi:unnamed protein product [Effrenium voratum]|nr:unnamed protein product [Effrenium voratum]
MVCEDLVQFSNEEEDQLRQQCDALEQRLRQDSLSFENEALEVQLMQIEDDHAQLREELRSTREFYARRIAEMTAELEDRARVTCTAKGHADCLGALLVFHEDNGRLAGSYWQAQCEKRDDSIRFLSLKLQEYTVPSSEYRSRRPHAGSVMASISEESSPVPSNSTNGASSSERPGVNPTALKAAERAFQALSDRHASLCEAVQTAEENALETEQNIQACELRSADLDTLHVFTLLQGQPTDEILPLDAVQARVAACNEVLASTRQLPDWSQRCAWRDELDIRAGQLERISLQFDTTKRSLDAANEELQWQATSAEALRIRLADVLRATAAEERRNQEVLSEEMRRSQALQALLSRWTQLRPDAPLPPACVQAQQLVQEACGFDSDKLGGVLTC